MKLLGLPGREPSTLAQMEALLARLEIGQTETEIRHHGFWATDWSDPDVLPEAEAVARLSADLVIAKSIGTLVAMLAVAREGFAPTACVFIATPLNRLIAEEEVALLEAHCAAIPTLFVQQSDDFNGAYGPLAQIVARHPGCAAVEIPGGDHLYEDIELIAPLIEAWVNDA
ncbi:MAG: hypothetical protein KA085_03030 [Phenylobacterium sp.]|uniref:hypothetical protein n=1 Tax=Phenylobacterium sp. TaxID=1871053 RepID=UPI001B4F53E1|nr:hypothetical protein [Phenylobacterium sp.]MBP7815072.1 hypothetical protein [Phenylobacterium sp.]MBP9231490.1 hypothetical protein [Phenylobacterium sp.]MBP9755662.1 hypothetical protein [Phenylobacterium sp.]